MRYGGSSSIENFDMKKTHGKVLVTGASGFIGNALICRLANEGIPSHAALRKMRSDFPPGVGVSIIPDISSSFNWVPLFEGVESIVHTAARVHIAHDISNNPLADFRAVNTEGTKNLALQAAKAGVKRIVFMSTIGVNGNDSGETLYTDIDQPLPHNPYAISKYEAELSLKQISDETGLEVVIIRTPLVYGPKNPGNFLTLLQMVFKGIPLPLAAIQNRRSFIFVENLVDALITCLYHPLAAGKTYLVSDGEDVSTPELIRRTASALGVPTRLFSVPVPLMKLVGELTGKSSAINRLTGSLTVDSSKIQQELGWVPPFTMEEGLGETARWFKNR